MKTSLSQALSVTVVAVSFTMLAPAQAAQPEAGPYVSAAVGTGVSALHAGGIDGAVAAQGVAVRSGNANTQDATYGLSLGYRINPHFALELGYANLGKYGYQSNAAAGSDAVVGAYKVHGYTAAALGIMPLSPRVSVYGKLGAIAAHTELRATGSGALDTANASHDSTGALLGAGASYALTPHLASRVEWNRYSNLGNASTAYGVINTYTVGLAYNF